MANDVLAKLTAAKERTGAAVKKGRPQAYSLTDETDPVKLLLFGHQGTGKTYLILGMLFNDERIMVLSSDFGGNGLVTIKNALRASNRLDLLKNLKVVDVATYEDVLDFLEKPLEFIPELEAFNPTVFEWEGFSSFNIDILDEYILSMAPGADSAGELRHAGFTHTQQDWQGMKRGTLRSLRKFLAFTLPNGTRMSKVLTALESKPEVDKLTQETHRGPLIHGTGRDIAGGGFDVILETYKENDKDGNLQYYYRSSGASSKFAVKNRGFALETIQIADPVKLWRILSGKEASDTVAATV